MASDGQERPQSEDDIDERLATEAGLSVAELREQGDVELPVLWEAEIVADRDG